MRKINFFLFLYVMLVFIPATTVFAGNSDAVQQKKLMEHVSWLADDARDGRGIGTPGLDASAVYIKKHFKKAGLKPLFENSYFQNFDMDWGIIVNESTSFKYGENNLKLYQDFTPVGFTGSATITAPLVFAGYGISADEYDYDDYAEIDAKGKIVVILEGEPGRDDPESKLEGDLDTPHSELRNKAINAKVKGAAGLVVVRTADENGDVYIPELRPDEPYRDVGIPAVFITVDAFNRVMSDNFSISNAQRSIDANQAPRSMSLGEDNLELVVDVKRQSKPVKNVAGVIPGKSDEIVVIGAHYDHLGYGQIGSTEFGSTEVHNGADDNASGVAVMLELADYFSENPVDYTLWFVAFTAEEVGIVGSGYFTDHAPANFDKVKFMFNIDMVGRVQNNSLSVLGVKSAEELSDIAIKAAEGTNLKPSPSGGGYGPSDQTSFYAKGIPVVQLLGSTHGDYHSPRDDADKINYSGLTEVFKYSCNFIDYLDDNNVILTYVEIDPSEQQSRRHDIKVSLGIIPDFAAPEGVSGMKLNGVRPNTPAAKAGLQGGDVLVKMGDVIIENIYDLTYALRQYNPGDEAEIHYVRDGEKHITHTTLVQARKRPSGMGGGHGKSSGGQGGGHPGKKMGE